MNSRKAERAYLFIDWLVNYSDKYDLSAVLCFFFLIPWSGIDVCLKPSVTPVKVYFLAFLTVVCAIVFLNRFACLWSSWKWYVTPFDDRQDTAMSRTVFFDPE